MKSHGWLHGRVIVAVAIAVALLAIHGIVLRTISTDLALPIAITAGVAILIVVKHLGLLGSLLAAVRGRTWLKRPRPDDGEP